MTRLRLTLIAAIAVLSVAVAAGARPTGEEPAPIAPSPSPVAAVPTRPEQPLTPLTCDARVPGTDRIAYAAVLSPDQSLVALATDEGRVGGLTKVAPDLEKRRIQLFDRTSHELTDLTRGAAPIVWSPDGTRVAFFEPQGGGVQVSTDLIVYDVISRRELTRVRPEPFNPAARVGWRGDELLYQVASTLRGWSPRGDRAVLHFEGAPDVLVSADGEAVAAATFGADYSHATELSIFDVATGRRELLRDVWRYAWSPAGHRLLVSYLDRSEIRDEDGAVRSYDYPLHHWAWQWSVDGRRPVFAEPGPVQPATESIGPLRSFITIDRKPAGLALPYAVATGALTRDHQLVGTYGDGWGPRTFALYDCHEAAPPSAERPATQTLYYPETTERWAADRSGSLPPRWREWLGQDLADAGLHPLGLELVRPIPNLGPPAQTCSAGVPCPNGFVLAITVPYGERERGFARCFQRGDGVTYIPAASLAGLPQANCIAL
ncbi:MAG: hypothetical protein E6J09_07040 [Chloroflexi bacterium]|nr:MAG: hypothetical protein E6J09_07040 [Chloroflexota bacterium]